MLPADTLCHGLRLNLGTSPAVCGLQQEEFVDHSQILANIRDVPKRFFPNRPSLVDLPKTKGSMSSGQAPTTSYKIEVGPFWRRGWHGVEDFPEQKLKRWHDMVGLEGLLINMKKSTQIVRLSNCLEREGRALAAG